MLTNKTPVVTGAASGIGRGIAVAFAKEGANVIVADVRQDPRQAGSPTHDRIAEETDAEVRLVDCDVSDPDDLNYAIDRAEDFDGLDLMVNNAGFRYETDVDAAPRWIASYSDAMAMYDPISISSVSAAIRTQRRQRSREITVPSEVVLRYSRAVEADSLCRLCQRQHLLINPDHRTGIVGATLARYESCSEFHTS